MESITVDEYDYPVNPLVKWFSFQSPTCWLMNNVSESEVEVSFFSKRQKLYIYFAKILKLLRYYVHFLLLARWLFIYGENFVQLKYASIFQQDPTIYRNFRLKFFFIKIAPCSFFFFFCITSRWFPGNHFQLL